MKGLERASSALLQHTRQMSTLALTSWSNKISEQIETLERAVGLMQHHDALTGTSSLAVTQDYNYRMTKGWDMAEQVLNSALNTISQNIKNNTNQQPPWVICRNINESECLFTKSNNTYIITVYNGNSQNLNTLVKVPLYQDITNVNLTDDKETPVEYQIVPVFNNSGQLDNPNMSTKEIWFLASAGPLGFQTYYVTLPSVAKGSTYERYSKNLDASTNSISNGLIQLDFDSQGRLSTFHDLKTGKNYPLTQEFAYYHGHNDRYNQQGTNTTITLNPMEIKTYQLTNLPVNKNPQSSTIPTSTLGTTNSVGKTSTTSSLGNHKSVNNMLLFLILIFYNFVRIF
uniref:Glycoside hydrolase family 38 central domain-containing protein n=1 Tax=Acrobeloides nanus TaxID=290746 RepID=A0A914DJT6_9BILA